MFKNVTVLILLLFLSCGGTDRVKDKLDHIESYIENKPETALKELESIDQNALSGKRMKAQYALLYSMALDKNYIDLKNDSIIAPAVSFYDKHGSPEDRLKTYYYLARIYMNAGDYEMSISSLAKAERYVHNCNNKLAVGRLYNAKMQVYQYLHDTSAMTKAALLSASAFLESGDTTRYLNAVAGAISGYLQVQDTDNAEYYLQILRDNKDNLNAKQKSRYFSALLYLAEDKGDPDMESILEEYLNECPESTIQWVSVAMAYYNIGKFPDALNALETYLEYGGPRNSSYHWTRALVQESLGNYADALDSYKEYNDLNSERNSDLFVNEARFIEERMASEIRLIKKNYTLSLLALILICVMLIAILAREKIKKAHKIELDAVERQRNEEKCRIEAEKEKYIKMYEAAKNDIACLKRALKKNRLDNETSKLVEERLQVLNAFVTANISRNYTKNAYEELSRLMGNQKHFLSSTRVSFNIAHPGFLLYLQSMNLTENEIEHCCLYCIGLNGSEIMSYLDKPSMYNFSRLLRQKLKVGKGIRIDTFLRMKMAEYD